eukprot:c3484_g1_i1.p1 GENE.c3484_g1_i1~~c3484_g1_i1.p1  ORF type:complete len:401 (-),score=59.02 c3484_g1_i1:219-1421(-)
MDTVLSTTIGTKRSREGNNDAELRCPRRARHIEPESSQDIIISSLPDPFDTNPDEMTSSASPDAQAKTFLDSSTTFSSSEEEDDHFDKPGTLLSGDDTSDMPYPTSEQSTPLSAQATSNRVENNANFFDIDQNRAHDARYNSEYAANTFTYFHHKQIHYMASPSYMNRQPDLTGEMRAVLVDWIVSVVQECHLSDYTLFLTVQIIDRFLGRTVVVRRDFLQLVGVSALLIASKFEDIEPPNVSFLVMLTDNTFTEQQVLEFETRILVELNFKVNGPTILTFLQRNQDAARLDDETKQLSHFIAELCLLNYEILRFRPSVIAASVIALSLHTQRYASVWSNTLAHYTLCSWSELVDCMALILPHYQRCENSQFKAVHNKYVQPNPYLCVARIHPPTTTPVA